MTATAAEKRTWLQAQGHDVPAKGKLPADLVAEFDAAHGEPLAAAFTPDYDEGVTEADFPSEPLDPEPPAETPPRRVRTSRSTKADAVRERIWGGGKGKPKAKAKRKPRVPLDRLISRGWQILARLAAPGDLPVARVLDMQAPVAGMLLEPIIKETILDTVLQPIARLEEGGEAVFALAGPPLLVGMLYRHPEMHAVLVPALEEAFTVWIEVAGPRVQEAKEKRARWEEGTGQQVQAMMQMVFAGIEGFDPTLEADEAGAEHAEDEAVARAQGML
jgi:hypothetical protein